MNTKKSFHALVKQMESLKEDQSGKLKGGFSSHSVSAITATGTNNCNCKNKNRGKQCAGCGSGAVSVVSGGSAL